jgi:RNAse (barnase) inhibitor barstar
VKSRRPSIELVEKWIVRGDGQGQGKNFDPFFYVRDVPSRGRSRMPLGLKTGRTHQLLSDIEWGYHLLAEDNPNIVDISECFALLPWQETQEIAHELGIRHPTWPGTMTPMVMTTDQVLTFIESGIESIGAICIKPSCDTDLDNAKSPSERARIRRVLEKILIEGIFWERRVTPFRVCTELDLPMNRVTNLDHLWIGMVSKELDRLDPLMPAFIDIFTKNWVEDRRFLSILKLVSQKLSLDIDHSYTLFARAVWLRLLPVDIDTEIIHYEKPLLHS